MVETQFIGAGSAAGRWRKTTSWSVVAAGPDPRGGLLENDAFWIMSRIQDALAPFIRICRIGLDLLNPWTFGDHGAE
jgi:hypothetical protein